MTYNDPWQESAACKGADTEIFYPTEPVHRRSSKYTHLTPEERVAVNYCNSCPVVTQCLRDALKVPREEDHGVRGGLPRRKRLKIRNQYGLDNRPVKVPA